MSLSSLSKGLALPHLQLACFRSLVKLPRIQKQMAATYSTTASINPPSLHCEVDAEPLQRYRRGGYHPTHLSDEFKDGRYKILHKLGWGGYATIWLAKDLFTSRYVAIKILISEISNGSRERSILEKLAHGPANHPGKKHVVRLLDFFEHEGPNGIHKCLVLEALGPNVLAEAERYKSHRLPGRIAWKVSRQATQALAYLHANGICHGDLHPGNIVFAPEPSTSYRSDEDVIKHLGEPETSDLLPSSGHSWTPHAPRYVVRPASSSSLVRGSGTCQIRLVDFGGAFPKGRQHQVNCPLVFRPPETILASHWDLRMDVWSLACTLFELVVGYPPFDNIFPKEDELIREWVSMFGDLPTEWGEDLSSYGNIRESEFEATSLRDWLCQTYFDDDKRPNFSRRDIDTLGDLLDSMLQYRPSDRPQASDLLNHTWFRRDPFDLLQS